MFIAFFCFWLILNGRITTEIVLFGLAISAGMLLFQYRFMGGSFRRDMRLLLRLPYLVAYFFLLVLEIISSTNTMLQFLLSPEKAPKAAIVHFQSGLQGQTARMLLANAITLTPGTLTVGLTGDDFYVHCYDKSMGEGIEDSSFVKLLRKMESH